MIPGHLILVGIYKDFLKFEICTNLHEYIMMNMTCGLVCVCQLNKLQINIYSVLSQKGGCNGLPKQHITG